jgi:hypothetical protein
MISWFISPWEAARLSLEAQRVMAFHFFRFACGQEPRQEALSDGEKASVPRQVDPSIVSSADLAMPAGPIGTVRPKTVPVRNATEVIRKPAGVRKVKDKRSKRKNTRRK